MNKDRDDIKKEIREELDSAGIFIVDLSMVQREKYRDVLEDMRQNGEVSRGDEVNESFTRPRQVYVN